MTPIRKYLLSTIIFGFLIIVFASCNQEQKPISVREISTPTKDIIYKIDISPQGRLTLLAGYVWSYGFTMIGDEFGGGLVIDTFSTKGQFDMLRTANDELVTVGTDGFFFIKPDTIDRWTFHRLQNWDILHHVIQTSHGFIASGGKAYETGYIFLIDSTFNVDTALYFGHEISEVVQISEDRLVSVGYGNIERSDDAGKTWRLLPNEGDFYASCLMLDQTRGFIVGYNGTLLETNDAGDTWISSKAQISGNGYNSFRKLKKTSDGMVFITGNGGNIWSSSDEGSSWTHYVLDSNADIYDIVLNSNGDYLIVGSDGYFAAMSL